MHRRRFLAGAATTALVPRAARAQTTVKLAVATAPIDSGIPAVVGVRAGIFRSYGLDVDVQFMNSGSAIAAAVAGGTLQAGASSLVGLVTAHARGIPFRIVAPGSIYTSDRPAEVLVVRKDAAIATAADLNGKTLATPALGDLLSTATFLWMDENGGDARTLKHVELPQTATPAAIEAGRVDVAALTEPRLSQALATGGVRVLAKMYDAIAKRFLVSAEFATADVIAANRDAMERFSRALRAANAFANEHPEQTAPWLADVAKTELDTVRKSAREQFDTAIVAENVQRVIDAAARYKTIPKAFPARELISPVALAR